MNDLVTQVGALWLILSVTTIGLCLAHQHHGNPAASQRRLNQFVRHFEPVEYDHADLHARHERVRRAAAQQEVSGTADEASLPAIHLRFKSHNRSVST